MSRLGSWPNSKPRSPSISSSIPPRCGSSPARRRRVRIEDLAGAETIVAIKLAQAAKAPVRVAFSRHEELSVAGYRPGTEIKIAILPGRDGTLKALSLDRLFRRRRRREFDRGRPCPSHLSGRGQGADGLRRRQQPAAGLSVPWAGRSANGLRAGTGDRRGGVKAQDRPTSIAQALGSQPNRQRLFDWAAGLETWRRYAGAPTGGGRYRRGVGVAAGYWFYLWQLGSTVELSIEGGSPRSGRRDAGHRHRDPQRHRRHGRPRVRARAARGRGAHRRFRSCRTDLGSGGSRVTASIAPAAPARGRQAQGRRRPEDRPQAGPRIAMRRGASSLRPRPISESRPRAPRTTAEPSMATTRW